MASEYTLENDFMSSDIYWVLKELDKLQHLNKTQPLNVVNFVINDQTLGSAPSSQVQRKILDFLASNKILTLELIPEWISTWDLMHGIKPYNPLKGYKVTLNSSKFNKILKKYRDNYGATKTTPIEEKKLSIKTLAENGKGYLQFGKKEDKICFGSVTNKPFKLLDTLCQPFGVKKLIATVYNAINDDAKSQTKLVHELDKKIKYIKYIFSECKRGDKINGKFRLKFDYSSKTVCFELKN